MSSSDDALLAEIRESMRLGKRDWVPVDHLSQGLAAVNRLVAQGLVTMDRGGLVRLVPENSRVRDLTRPSVREYSR